MGLAEGIGVPALDMSPALKIPKGGWLVKAAGWATSCRNSHAGAQLETSQLFQDGHVVRPGRLPARQPEAQPNHFHFRCAENPLLTWLRMQHPFICQLKRHGRLFAMLRHSVEE